MGRARAITMTFNASSPRALFPVGQILVFSVTKETTTRAGVPRAAEVANDRKTIKKTFFFVHHKYLKTSKVKNDFSSIPH
jgi:hypothetical protein